MKVTHITQLLLLFILLIFFTSCGGSPNPDTDGDETKDDDIEIVDEPDSDQDIPTQDDDSSTPGTVGDPCTTKQDCITPLLCVDHVCAGNLPPTDEDFISDEDFEIDDGDTTVDEDTDNPIIDIDNPIIDVDENDDNEWLDWDGTASCGNGIVEPGENCDDNNNVDDDYCGNDCLTINGRCGDNITQKYEKCDDGNTDDGDYCSADCLTPTGACGDGTVQTGETCDDGDNNGKYGFCSSFCDGPGVGCGDGVLQGNRERCDDGNTVDGDYCSSDCQTIIGVCGDWTLQPTEEVCDDGNRDDGDYCSADCQTQNGSCGDGIKQDFEECEDGNPFTDTCEYGNTTGCTVCNAICRYAPGRLAYCGDDFIDYSHGEICDDGDANGDYGKCAADCVSYAPYCGDGTIDSGEGETCDDGEDNGTYGHCSSQCDGNARCGDGFRDPAHETCDDGNTIDGDYCSADCTTETGYCGDWILQLNEECEDKNDIDDDYCTNSCKDNGSCGDETQQSNESCDDGANNGSYGYCSIYCDGQGAHCGDGILDDPPEACDGTSELCFDYGAQYMDGYAPCKIDCSEFDTSLCDTFKASLLPGTGLTACYNTTTEITCPTPSQLFYGQDANFAHNPLTATTVETLSGDRVVTLDSTGIMWQGTLSTTSYAAANAISYCDSLSYAGFSDWTLPDIAWFANLLDDYENVPHIVPDLASSSESVVYWASTQQGAKQWTYNLADATTSLDATTATHKVQCARNIPAATFYDAIAFTTKDVSGDTYYSEAYSGLDWTLPIAKPPVTTIAHSWEKALSSCIFHSYAGFTDWRLPTAVELLILANTEYYDPASMFPAISSLSYWSSTTSVEANEKAFVIDILDGSTKAIDKTQSHPFYCVRAR